MKKRLLTLTLVMAIMCSLAACGTAPAPSGTSSTPTPPANSAGGSSPAPLVQALSATCPLLPPENLTLG